MFDTQHSTPLAKIFRRTQFKIAFLAIIICSCAFLACTSLILKSIITKEAEQHIQHIQYQIEKEHKPPITNRDYAALLHPSIENFYATTITLKNLSNEIIWQEVTPHKPVRIERYLNQIFFPYPLTQPFVNNTEHGVIHFEVRTFPYLMYFFTVFITLGFMLLILPTLLMYFFYHTYHFLDRNISPLVQAIHQFNQAEYLVKKRDYSYIREIQFFSETFNTLVNKFESTKQNLAEQNVLLEWQANHDVLTQLPNRQYFQKYLLKEFNHNQHSNMVVLFIDNNKFKAINDTFGHQAGDAILIETATRLKNNLNNDDFIARLGGDEFAAVLRRVENYQDLVDICERLRFCCHEPLIFESNTIPFSFSIGASYAYHANNVEELLHHADLAMYKAKLSEKKWHIYKRESAFAYTDY